MKGTKDVKETENQVQQVETSKEVRDPKEEALEFIFLKGKEAKTKTALKEAILEGLTMFETAIKSKQSRMRVDRVEYIKGLTNLSEIRAAIKGAHAKKSKAGDNRELLEKYLAELRLAERRLNEVLSSIREDPLALLKAGEEPNRVAQQYLVGKEKELRAAVEVYELKRVDLKKRLAEQRLKPAPALEDLNQLGEEVSSIFWRRASRDDKRVQNVIRIANLLENLKNSPPPKEVIDTGDPKTVKEDKKGKK